MTQNFIDMLKLFACGAAGVEFKADKEINIEEVRRLAIEQSVWQTVFAGISDSANAGNLTVEPELFSKLKREVMASVRSSMMKNEYTAKVLSEISDGLKYCVLKGQTVARLYKYPDMRVSSDVDILIDQKDADEWAVRLKNAGYNVETPNGIEHHFGAVYPIGGLLEVHTEMYYKATGDILLKGLVNYNEPYINCDGIPSLGINDSLMFLTAHLLKHFLNGAAGLRQICDLLMHMKHYNSEIDWKKYNELMDTLGFTGFISAIKGIGSKYFGFDFEDADEALGDILLDDTEIGGNFGHNDSEKGAFYYDFLKQRTDMTEKEFNAYYDKYSRGTMFKRLFPNIKSMQKQFPKLKEAPCLLPAYWVIRLGGIFVRVVSGERAVNNLPSAESESVKRRRELTKKLGMMK